MVFLYLRSGSKRTNFGEMIPKMIKGSATARIPSGLYVMRKYTHRKKTTADNTAQMMNTGMTVRLITTRLSLPHRLQTYSAFLLLLNAEE